MDRKYHWFAGFVIYCALLNLMNHFVNYALDSTQFMLLTFLSYTICIIVILERKWFVRLLVVFLLLTGGAYILDGLLENIYKDEIILQNDMIASSDQEAFSSGVIIYKNVHSLRQKLDYQKITHFVNWLTDTRGNEDVQIYVYYESVLLILMSFGVALLLQLIMRYQYSKIILMMPFFAFIWMWYQYIDLPRKIYAYYFIGVFIFYVLDRQDYLKKHSQHYGQMHYKTNGLFKFSAMISIAIVSVTLIVTAVFPVDMINQFTDPIVPNFWGGRTAYSSESIKMYTLNDTPYQSKDNQLGGPITAIDRDTVLFWVKTDQKQSESLYLKGNVKDYFDGYQWLSHANTYKKAYEFYLSEPKNQDYIGGAELNKVSGTIQLDQMKTVTLFTPMGLYETSLGDHVFVSIDNEAFYKAGAFVKFLGTYKFTSSNKDFLFSNEVDYLQLPDNIDNGTYQLSRTLANYGLSDYEKMVIMTKFLLKNYNYTLYPPEYHKEKDRDFVSQFIFETREGYCTYFATALTVMARINEIPARYVEGFRIDPNLESREGFAAVTEGDAHAWCEVYIKDKGWVIFESTPPYASEMLSLNRLDNDSIDTMIEDASNFVLPQKSQEINAFKEALLDEKMIMGDDGGQSGSVKPNTKSELALNYKCLITILMICIAGSILVVVGGFSFINLRMIRPNGTRKQALRMVNYMTYLLKVLYPQRGSLVDQLINETPLEVEAQMKILELVYNGRHPFDVATINETTGYINEAIRHLEIQFSAEFGRLKLEYIKIFNLRKIVL